MLRNVVRIVHTAGTTELKPRSSSQGAAACLAVSSLVEACILVRICLLSMDGVAMALRPKLDAG